MSPTQNGETTSSPFRIPRGKLERSFSIKADIHSKFQSMPRRSSDVTHDYLEAVSPLVVGVLR